MTTHVRGPDESASVAKLGMYGTIGAAVIGAVTTLGVGIYQNWSADAGTPPSVPAPTDSGGFSFGLDGNTAKFSGAAAAGVDGMFVLIGPKADGGYWPGYGPVTGDRWKADVAIESPWKNYEVTFVPQLRSGGVRPSAFGLSFDPPGPSTPPPSPQGDLLQCAAVYGASCFQGPGFGAPTVQYPSA